MALQNPCSRSSRRSLFPAFADPRSATPLAWWVRHLPGILPRDPGPLPFHRASLKAQFPFSGPRIGLGDPHSDTRQSGWTTRWLSICRRHLTTENSPSLACGILAMAPRFRVLPQGRGGQNPPLSISVTRSQAQGGDLAADVHQIRSLPRRSLICPCLYIIPMSCPLLTRNRIPSSTAS